MNQQVLKCGPRLIARIQLKVLYGEIDGRKSRRKQKAMTTHHAYSATNNLLLNFNERVSNSFVSLSAILDH